MRHDRESRSCLWNLKSHIGRSRSYLSIVPDLNRSYLWEPQNRSCPERGTTEYDRGTTESIPECDDQRRGKWCQEICIRRVKRKRRRISSNMKQMGTMGLKSRSRKCIEYGYPHIWFGTKARGLDHIYRGKKPKIEKLKKCMTRSVFN